MDWKNTIEDILQRYAGNQGGTAAASADPHQNFRQVAENAPPDVVANGISQAFRSDQTPPFAEMLSNLFNHTDPTQRAGLLNRLLSSLGPGALTSLPGLAGLSSIFTGKSITPEQASQVSSAEVQQAAARAERQNPSIIDEVSKFYSQHPEVMKAAGGLALTIALQHMLKRH